MRSHRARLFAVAVLAFAVFAVFAVFALAMRNLAHAGEPGPRAKTHFAASPRERFVTMLWLSGDAAKSTSAQEETLRLWSRLKLREVQAQAKGVEKGRRAKGDGTPVDADDFSDELTPFEADRDEVEALARALAPRDDRPMPNSFSLVLGPFRQRLDALLGKR